MSSKLWKCSVKSAKSRTVALRSRDYAMLNHVVRLINEARRTSARTVNTFMTATYWSIGRHIVEFELSGKKRAEYGEELLEWLSADLTSRFGRGFSRPNLQQMRQLYQAFPLQQICQTPSDKSSLARKIQTASGKSPAQRRGKSQTLSDKLALGDLAACFPLPWSAYVRLLSVRNEQARKFYETEALRGGWSVRQLDRQINSLFYERTALSRNKAKMLSRGSVAKPEDAATAEEKIKDPYVLEFLGLKDEYSEADIEEALILYLEHFLLEVGGDFTFVGCQRRLRIGDEWYRIDLLFFHRKLRCLVVIDLKRGKFTHADAGQMHMYLNYAREHWTRAGENPPVGLNSLQPRLPAKKIATTMGRATSR
ncbi:MAG TPA: PDDEXK nuclease domain-containing protein [Candidatus Udaeobacter sp.]|nr:PDDEXK nuclease domain-containing protein [Candidatus Udaeobacter sp.]